MDKNEVFNNILANKHVAIYGAAVLGHKVAAILRCYKKHFDYFVITDNQGKNDEIYDSQVKSIYDVADELRENGTLILIANKWHYEVESVLKSLLLNNYLIITDEQVSYMREKAIKKQFREIGLDLDLFSGMKTNEIFSLFSTNKEEMGENFQSVKQMMFKDACIKSAQYANKYMINTKILSSRAEIQKWSFNQISIQDGLILEFGVADGQSINVFAGLTDHTIYGFDSFEGLPESWNTFYTQGSFKRDSLPYVKSNVKLISGWFDETLPQYVNNHYEKCAFIHIDCDLYESTKCVFDCLAERISSGTIILFDEYFNYPGWENHEFRAFQEFVQKHKVKYEYIAFVDDSVQVAVRIL